MGKEKAELDEKFQTHAPELLRWLKGRIPAALAPRIDPEDVLHETYLLALQKYPAYKARPTMAIRPWFFRAARDCYLRHWRDHSAKCRDPQRELPWPKGSSVQFGLNLIAKDGTPSANAVQEEQFRLVRQAMERLDADDKELLEMRDWAELSFAEIAKILGKDEGALRVQRHRALKRLGNLLQS